ncbi:hypothetical protein D1872_314530 [compost metagenome]
MLVASYPDPANLASLEALLHSLYQSFADALSPVVRMNGNAVIAAMVLVNRANQGTYQLTLVLCNHNKIRIPRQLTGKCPNSISVTLFR